MNSTIDVYDFFSGCGGTSLGFRNAGMNLRWAMDFDADAAKTYKSNFPCVPFAQKDIQDIRLKDLPNCKPGNARLFVGCAPCQPFSRAKKTSSKEDSRKSLLLEFLKFVVFHQPEYVFVENVPGLKSGKATREIYNRFTTTLRELGYHVTVDRVQSLHYGIPQRRLRLVILASLHSLIQFPAPSHGNAANQKSFSTIKEWIADLPKLTAGETNPVDPNHQAASITKKNIDRLRLTPQGGGWNDWPYELWLDCHKRLKSTSYYSDVYGRLSWNKPAPTLTTKCTSITNGRFGHPEQDRALSIREAALLQTFPASFKFFGTQISKTRQVGNAVPVLMAQRFGEQILKTERK